MDNKYNTYTKPNGKPTKKEDLERSLKNMKIHIQNLREDLHKCNHLIDKIDGLRISAELTLKKII